MMTVQSDGTPCHGADLPGGLIGRTTMGGGSAAVARVHWMPMPSAQGSTTASLP